MDKQLSFFWGGGGGGREEVGWRKCGILYADWCQDCFYSTAKVSASSANQPWKHHWSKLKSCLESISAYNSYYSLFKLSRFVFGCLEETDPSSIISLGFSQNITSNLFCPFQDNSEDKPSSLLALLCVYSSKHCICRTLLWTTWWGVAFWGSLWL